MLCDAEGSEMLPDVSCGQLVLALRSEEAGQGRGFALQKEANQQGRLERRELILWNGFTRRHLHI